MTADAYGYSPSAIDVVDRCEVLYAAKYPGRLKEPQGEKAALGDRCHHITEAYLVDGTAPNRAEQMEITTIEAGTPRTRTYYPGRIAQNIFTHLPPAGSLSRDQVESKIGFTYRGVRFTGRKDWSDSSDGKPPIIGDHKFTSSVDYIKTLEQLTGDAQKCVYAGDMFTRTDAAEGVAQWTYGTFDAKHSRKVVLPLYREEFARLLDTHVMPKVERMEAIRARYAVTQDWTVFEPTGLKHFSDRGKNACEDTFGKPCFLASKCPHATGRTTGAGGSQLPAIWGSVTKPTGSVLGGIMSSSLLARLKGTAAPGAAAPTAPANNQTPAAAAPSAVEPPAPPAAVAPPTNPDGSVPTPTINPPGERCEMPKADEVDAPPMAAPPAIEALALPAPAAETPAKRRPGRPKKEETPALPAPAAAPAAALERTDGKKLILLVDCVVQRADAASGAFSEVLDASDLIAQANRHIAKQFPEVLAETGPHYMFHTFGKGRAMLATALEALIAELPAATAVAVSTRSPEGADALQTFVQAAAVVFRGVA